MDLHTEALKEIATLGEDSKTIQFVNLLISIHMKTSATLQEYKKDYFASDQYLNDRGMNISEENRGPIDAFKAQMRVDAIIFHQKKELETLRAFIDAALQDVTD